jgi:hypothetical protein
MKTTLIILAFFLTFCVAANAQVVPAATGPGGLPLRSSLQYALRYSETDQVNSDLPDMQTATASGSLDYSNSDQRLPFMMNYVGGYTWTITGPSYETGQFHRLLLSQGIAWRKWKVMASDNVSYLPQSPTTGFSGIPGIGEPIGGPSPVPATSQTILAQNTHIVDNSAIGEVEHDLTYATTLSASGSSELLRYPDANGLDTNALNAIATFTRRLDARNDLFGRYMFSEYSYPDFTVTIQTNTGYLGYRHKWSRTLTTDVSAGPQWIESSDNAAVPNSTNVSVNAAINYLQRFTSATLSYSRGTNGGAGYLLGAEVDTVNGNFSQEFGRNLTMGLTAGYVRTLGLNNNGVTIAKYGGAQATWRLGRNVIVFANYTGTDQTSSSTLPTNALGQLVQVIGFGIGYSPREKHIRQ